MLGRYAREEGLLTLPQAVAKMTGNAARALGMTDRGLLREGWAADIAVFDAETIRDEATFDEPHTYPTGVETVIVNGRTVIHRDGHTGALPGRLLRRREGVLS